MSVLLSAQLLLLYLFRPRPNMYPPIASLTRHPIVSSKEDVFLFFAHHSNQVNNISSKLSESIKSVRVNWRRRQHAKWQQKHLNSYWSMRKMRINMGSINAVCLLFLVICRLLTSSYVWCFSMENMVGTPWSTDGDCSSSDSDSLLSPKMHRALLMATFTWPKYYNRSWLNSF